MRDIIFDPKKKIVKLKREAFLSHTLRYFSHLPRLATSGFIGLLVVTLLFYNWYAAGADVISLFPESCLGDWDRPELMTSPEVDTDGSESDFTTENSATVMNRSGRVFCGKFGGKDLPGNARITAIKLNVAVAFKGETPIEINEEALSPAGVIDQNFGTSTTSTSSPPTSTSTLPISTSTPPLTTTPPILDTVDADDTLDTASTTYWWLPGYVVYAQEDVPTAEPEPQQPPEPAPEPAPEPVPEEQPEPEPVPVQEEPQVLSEEEPVQKEQTDEVEEVEEVTEETVEILGEVEGIATSTAPSASSTEEVIEEVVVTGSYVSEEADDTSVEIAYTLNGEEWQTLDKAYESQAYSAVRSYTLPIESLEDAKNIQVALHNFTGERSFDKIYVDSVSLDIEYVVEGETEVKEEREGNLPPAKRFAYRSGGFLEQSEEVNNNFEPKPSLESAPRCSVNPLSQEVKRGEEFTMTVSVEGNDLGKPYQLRTSDLLRELEVTNVSELSSSTPKRKEIAVTGRLIGEVAGSYTMLFAYDVDYGFNNVATAICNFNVKILSEQ